jgi:diacylglycerol kinase (ATP)
LVRKIVLFANPLIASRRARDLQKVLHVFEQAGVQVEFQETGPNRAAGENAKQAAERGIDGIVVCGGDGTVFDTLQGLAGSETPLGIIPLGTGNILAQNLHIPGNPAAAARWLLRAKPCPVPLGKITCCTSSNEHTWFFAIAAGMGIHAAMMDVAHRLEKRRMGRMAYFAGGIKALFSYPVQPFHIKVETVEGTIFERQASEAIALRVAELNLWRTGADLNLPFLRLASVEGDSRPRLVKASFEALLLGAGRRDRPLRAQNAAHYENVLRVECRPIPGLTHKAPLAVQADGEILCASCARIEMAGLSVRFLSRPHDLAQCGHRYTTPPQAIQTT